MEGKKVVFITGTSTGFGKLMTITLSKVGYRVVAGMRGTADRNETVANELSDSPMWKWWRLTSPAMSQ